MTTRIQLAVLTGAALLAFAAPAVVSAQCADGETLSNGQCVADNSGTVTGSGACTAVGDLCNSNGVAGTCKTITPTNGETYIGCVAGNNVGSSGVVTSPSTTGTSGVVSGQAANGLGQNQRVGTVYLVNPLGQGGTLMGFIQAILGYVVRLGTIVIIAMMVYVGFRFVADSGKPAEIVKDRSMLMWTIIGALILLGAQAIALSIQATVTAITGGS